MTGLKRLQRRAKKVGLTMAALLAFASAANAQLACGGGDYHELSGNEALAVCNSEYARFIEEWPCRNVTDGAVGLLGWKTVNTVSVSLPCGGDNGISSGGQSLIPNAGNTPTGFALARVSGSGAGTISNPATTPWAMAWRIRVLDLDEVVVKLGIGDEIATESVDHAAANQDFIGVIFKDEDTDTGGECGGTTGDSANWQFHSVKAGVSAGLQDSGVMATTSTWLWMRAHSTRNGVEVCVEHTDTGPTRIGISSSASIGTCYEETNSANVSVSNLSPFIIVSSCDGSSVGGNANRVEIDYTSLVVSRY